MRFRRSGCKKQEQDLLGLEGWSDVWRAERARPPNSPARPLTSSARPPLTPVVEREPLTPRQAMEPGTRAGNTSYSPNFALVREIQLPKEARQANMKCVSGNV